MAAAVIALGAVLYFTTRPAPPPPAPAPRPYVWSFDMDQLARIRISLPRTGRSEAWVEHADRYWYFDAPGGPEVDLARWGGGIPLILSGPGANRLIAENATADQQKVYGLAAPLMQILLTLKNNDQVTVDVGDATPDGGAYYIRKAGSPGVFTVDATWYRVLERLVLDPPYPKGGKK